MDIIRKNKNDFSYLKEKDIYLDGACQSLRPEPVIAALENITKSIILAVNA